MSAEQLDRTVAATPEPIRTSTPKNKSKNKSGITFADERNVNVTVYTGANINVSLASKNVSLTLPEIPAEAKEYVPMPYTFRVPLHKNKRKDGKLLVKTPPAHVLLDHTLAVIWTLYNKKVKAKMGVVQLYWAMRFLQSIRTKDNNIPDDCRLIIYDIEDLIVEEYANLSDSINMLTELEVINLTQKDIDDPDAVPMSINYDEMIEKVKVKKATPTTGLYGGEFSMTDEIMINDLSKMRKQIKADTVEGLKLAQTNEAVAYLSGKKEEWLDTIKLMAKRVNSLNNLIIAVKQSSDKNPTRAEIEELLTESVVFDHSTVNSGDIQDTSTSQADPVEEIAVPDTP